MENVELIQIRTINSEEMGSLSFFETGKDIKFQIKRIYYTYNVPQQTQRGGHAHKNLQQVLFCPHGKIEIILDNGYLKETYVLDSPEKVLIVGNNIWREMIWKQEYSILCVGASDHYNENDYIRNYIEFLELVKRS